MGLPIRAGAVAKFPLMAVKLKGATAATNPSKPRKYMLFSVFTGSPTSNGLYFRASYTNCTLKRKKSMSSHAASISVNKKQKIILP